MSSTYKNYWYVQYSLEFHWDSERMGSPQGIWASRRIHELNGPYQSTLLLIKFMHTNGNVCLPPPPLWHVPPWSQHSHKTCICKIKHTQINFMYILFPHIPISVTDPGNWAWICQTLNPQVVFRYCSSNMLVLGYGRQTGHANRAGGGRLVIDPLIKETT